MPARFPETPEVIRPQNGRESHFVGDIVVSGLSGRLPESETIGEFKANLFNGVDMVTADDRRWPVGLYGLPSRNGKIKDLSKFDANFFGVHAKQADLLDPQVRMMLESTFEAIIDAGYNPEELRGTNTGVFVGCSASESGEMFAYNIEKINGYGLTGSARSMFPNRISFTFDFKGPSFAIDTACSSSMLAFHQAVSAMRNGECDAAIVGGVNLLLKPAESLQFHRLSMLSPDGSCKAFDVSGNGYVRSEACVTVLLQRASAARRAYAFVVNTGTNCDGNKELGITYPSGKVQQELIEKVFNEIGMNPNEVSYVEAHGTGTKVGDPQEVNAIARVFCKNRSSPLLIGSVKSNMGHSEPASGLCSLAKVLIAMEAGKIPQNLHFVEPNKDIPALSDGEIQVVHKNWEWNGGIAAINSFGFGGANVHVVLRSNPKPKVPAVKDSIPRLICVSGRTEEAVDFFLKNLEEMPRDDELITLIHTIYKQHIPGHAFRGYTLLGSNGEQREISDDTGRHQVWYVFSGMGSQWPGMGRAYMCLQPFADTIHRCAAALAKEGVDLLNLIYHGTEETFDSVLNCFVSIAAIQVALVDLLTSLGISPDHVIGHSAGEMGCAYADGTLTAEQAVLAAYWRGKSVIDSKLIPGAMAAVGLTWEETKARLPPTVIAACHNGADSVTISGPISDLDKVVKEFQADNIFAKKVQSSGIAFHSKYIADAAPKLRANLEKIIPAPKPRSKRWLSSSIPEAGWGSQLAALSSAAYHVNNLLSPVLFHEVVMKIPEDSIVLEIAPHCLLQAVLKRSLPKNTLNVGLFKKGIPDELSNFIANIGKVFIAGLTPDLSVFHRPTSFPVGRGTPAIAPLIKWDHSVQWAVANYKLISNAGVGESVIEVNIANEADSYITGHTIDGRVLFPATGYLTLVWKTFAKIHEKQLEEMCVTMKNVSFLRATIMPKDGPVKFTVSIFDGSGTFEVCEGGNTVVTGEICVSEGIAQDGLKLSAPVPTEDKKLKPLEKPEVYRDLRLRGYDYRKIFQGIKKSDNQGANGVLEWCNNWVSFMDTMLQFSLVGMNTRELYLPTRLLRVTIDPKTHLATLKGGEEIAVQMYRNIRVIRSGGIEIRGMKASLAPRRVGVQAPPKLEQYKFVPYKINKEVPLEDVLSIAVQLALENASGTHKLSIMEAYSEKVDPGHILAPAILKTLESEPMAGGDITVASQNSETYKAILEPYSGKTSKKDLSNEPVGSNLHLIVTSKLLEKGNSKNALESIKDGGFILTLEDTKQDISTNSTSLEVVSTINTEKGVFVLLRKCNKWNMPEIIDITSSDFSWVEAVKKAMKESEKTGNKYMLVSDTNADSGLIGMFNCIKQEPGGENFRCVFLADGPTKGFNLKDHKDQLKKDLLVNVYKNGVWGSMRHLLISSEESFLDVEHAYVNTLTRGDLSSLRWIEGPLTFFRPEHDQKSELCSVYCAPLNFKDVMIATGKLPPDSLPGRQAEMECILGLEFAGRNTKGQRVMGMVVAQAMATSVLADPAFLWPIPAKWSMEAASTIPVVYGTSYYALVVRGRMRKGESVLIHAGTGGVGQASINIALHMGCEVFTTVGSKEKKAFLLKNFPKLKECNIGNSRDTSFEQMIMESTSGRGVDLVLNSLAADMLQASVRCLAEHGRFLEIGKLDLSNNTALGMAIFLKNITFHGVLLDAIFEIDENNEDKKAIMRLMKEGLESGAVKPLPATTFPQSQIEQAFRYMATGKHIGKVVIRVKEEELEKMVKGCKPATVPAVPRAYMNPDKSYIVLGGLGGFGLELSNWLLYRGAGHLVLVSSRGVTTGYQSMCLRRWAERGYNVVVSTEDATTIKGATKLVETANKLAPVGGIFNLAAVLRDAYMENQTKADFEVVCKVKVDTTKNLDLASRKLCPQLDYFVAFSSVSCGRGNAGQANYGLANSVMERVCEARQAAGLPATAIQWGAVGDVGLVIDGLKGDNETVVGGTLPQRITSCLATIDKFLQTSHPVLASMVLAERRKKSKDSSDVSLIDAVANILGLKDVKNVPGASSLADLGMDSLMGAEIKQTLERGFDMVLSPAEIRSLTFAKLRSLSSGGEKEVTQNGKSEELTTNGTVSDDVVAFQTDRLMPTEPIVKMKSASNSLNKQFVFFVHAIEGTVASLEKVAEATKDSIEIWGLQWTAETPYESIEKVAANYIQFIKKIQPKGPYRIVGYSFGAMIAFEIGVQLETIHKENVNLICLDGTPDYVSGHTGKYRETRNKRASESDAFVYFISLFNPKLELEQILKNMVNLPDYESRLKLCTSTLKPLLSNRPEKEISQAADLFYRKLFAAEQYSTTTKFTGPVMLVKASDSFTGFDLVNSLSEVCKQTVLVHTMKGNHRTILQGDSGAAIGEIISAS